MRLPHASSGFICGFSRRSPHCGPPIVCLCPRLHTAVRSIGAHSQRIFVAAAQTQPLPQPLPLGVAVAPEQALPATASQLTSTALVFAHLRLGGLIPSAELAARQRNTSAFFSGAAAHGIAFDQLVSHFTVLLLSDNMGLSNGWFQRARLWRLVLLAECTGGAGGADNSSGAEAEGGAEGGAREPKGVFWDNGEGVALALLAAGAGAGAGLVGAVGARKQRRRLGSTSCLQVHMQSWRTQRPAVHTLLCHLPCSAFQPGYLTSSRATQWTPRALLSRSPQAVKEDGARTGDGSGDDDQESLIQMCPVSGFSAEAIASSTPAALRELELHTAGAVRAERIWTTCLALAALSGMREHYACEVGGVPGAAVTLTDRATGWLAAQAAGCKALKAALPGVAAQAAALTASWAAGHRRLLVESKRWETRENRYRAACEAQRMSGHLLHRLLRTHGARRR